ncbi:hypothetical protein BCV69DRAFT_281673 [Microstroma glucosiphilum]|uniref:Uncharacterized protein n=1 Tax=Pseudomicrostroma glucosiphilum TaxID=1684307 RepID=A0A316UA98_9BASI|nr:hypothetical protein BCV69DRAFT_281673 [Pseudomicrostroma glucosiphilum]PWN21744.1 hypothetical protein BCV69DRAFT_281673 [Pseudomicrostroma glucosiphilum]
MRFLLCCHHSTEFTVLYYWYFQPTVEFIAPGGSGNWYPAHGCQNTCVKGLMAANYAQDPSVQVRGDKNNPDTVVCMSPRNLENEMVFYMQKPN